MSQTEGILQRTGADRGVAMAGYALLFISVFSLGVTGVAAVILAYAARDQVSPGVRRHFNAQIGLFWTAFALSILAIAAMLGGIGVIVADAAKHHEGWTVQQIEHAVIGSINDFNYSLTASALIVGSVIGWLVAALVTLIGPGIGFSRLAIVGPKGVTANS